MIETKQSSFSDPALINTFIFAMLSFVFWASMTGRFSDGALLGCALIQLGSYATFLISSYIFMHRSQGFAGGLNLVFATCFAGVGGLLNLGAYFCSLYKLPFDGKPGAVVFLVCGLLLLITLPAIKDVPWIGFITNVLSAVGLIIDSFTVFGFLPSIGISVAGWIFCAIGVLCFYTDIVLFCGESNIKLPLGKSLFK